MPFKPKPSEIMGETSRGAPRPRLLGWLKERDAQYGTLYTTATWRPEGEKPEVGIWLRAPWLDEPPESPGSETIVGGSPEKLHEITIASCRACPFAGESSGEAVTCQHPKLVLGDIPFGFCEDSWAARSEPPAGCPLRRESVKISLEK